MAMPPDGQSAWFKSADNWNLVDRSGVFASIVVYVSGDSAQVNMPCTDSAYSFFAALRIEQNDGHLFFQVGHGPRVPWTPSRVGEQLVAPDQQAILPRHSVLGPDEGASAIASLRGTSQGAIELLDANGAVRIAIGRANPTALYPEATRLDACSQTAAIWIADHPGCKIEHQESSAP